MRLILHDQLEELADDELIARVANGSEQAFEELYRRHAAAIVSIVRQFTDDRSVADESTQAAFFALWEKASKLDRGSRLRSWLATVARNYLIDKHRRKHIVTTPISAQPDRPSNEHGPEEQAIMNERSLDIRAALRALSADQRLVIEMAYFGGLSQSEIASVTGEPLGTVKSRVRLGMQRLRHLLAPEAPA